MRLAPKPKRMRQGFEPLPMPAARMQRKLAKRRLAIGMRYFKVFMGTNVTEFDDNKT